MATPSDSPQLRALCFALPAAAEGDVPQWIPYLPAPGPDGWIKGDDGRKWRVPDPHQLAQNLRRKIPVDVNHSTEIAARIGSESPAYGWINELRVNPDRSIDAKVDWTERGRNAVAKREYAFVSPAFDHTSAGDIKRPVSLSLLNVDPNLSLPALNRQQPTEETPMLVNTLALLGLTPNATDEEAVRAVNKLKGDLERATNAAATPPLEKFVPRADYDAALTRATNAETKLTEQATAAHGQAVEAEIDTALKDGQITPATKDFYRATCATAEGLQQFRNFRKSAPKLLPDQIVHGAPPVATGASQLTDTQRAICKRMGLSEKDYLASLNPEA